ncbi:MAG: hypothetical protein ABSE39_13400 [Candidatus Bathyarchaeia archaeon]|jgi:hypothetical protein
MPAIAGVITIKMKKMTAIEYTPFVTPALDEKRSKKRRNREGTPVELAVLGLVPCTVHSTQQARLQTTYERGALNLTLETGN